jgi:hypothetical protein
MNFRNLAEFKTGKFDTLTLLACSLAVSAGLAPRSGAPALAIATVLAVLALRATWSGERTAKRKAIEEAIAFIRKSAKNQLSALLLAAGPTEWEIERHDRRLAEYARLSHLRLKAHRSFGNINPEYTELATLGGEKRFQELQTLIEIFQKDYDPAQLPQGKREPWRQANLDEAFKNLREALKEAVDESTPLDVMPFGNYSWAAG